MEPCGLAEPASTPTGYHPALVGPTRDAAFLRGKPGARLFAPTGHELAAVAREQHDNFPAEHLADVSQSCGKRIARSGLARQPVADLGEHRRAPLAAERSLGFCAQL